jgi:hypothetical protein
MHLIADLGAGELQDNQDSEDIQVFLCTQPLKLSRRRPSALL